MTRTQTIHKALALMTCAIFCATSLLFAGANPNTAQGDRGTDSMSLNTAKAVEANKAPEADAPLLVGCPTQVIAFEGSTSGNSRAPNPNFTASRGVYIVTPAEMAGGGIQNGAVPGAIGWHYLTAPSGARSGNLKIYLENTADTQNNKSTTWATVISTMTKVSDSTQTLPASTNFFDLNFSGGSPFTYTGGGLYVAWDWTSGGTATTGTIVSCNTAVANGILIANSASPTVGPISPFRPETRLTPAVGFGNDAGVDQVMSIGVVPNGLVGSQVVQAVVTNKGTSAINNVTVSLNVTGSNPFSNNQVVPTLSACGGTATVSFAGMPITTLGSNTVTVSVPNDDNNTNNSKAKPLDITANRYSYKYPGSTASGGVGFTTGVGQFAGRFNTTSATQIDTVNVEFFAVTATTYKIAIYGDSGGTPGTLIYEDAANRTVAVAGPQALRLSPPVSVGPGNFYISIEQTASNVNANYSFDTEVPLRLGSFFLTDVPAAAWTDFAPANPFKLNIGATLGSCVVPLSVNVTPDSASTCQGTSIQFTCNVTGGTGTYTYQWTENGIDIGGATSSTYLATHAGPGAFTYNCKVTDDGGCTNVQDVSASTGTWIANGGSCEDGNPCTGPDTCGGGTCQAGPNPCNDNDACTNDICDGIGGCTYTAVNCNDNNVCTTDGCNTVSGCTHTNVGGPCSDNNACTVGDSCSGGVCVPGSTPTPVQFCNATSLVIRDGSAPTTASVYPTSINVSGLGPVLCKATVNVSGLQHTFPDDVDMLLAGPTPSQNAIILSDVGGGTAITGINLTLDDAAGPSIPDGGPITSGTFKPTNVNAGSTGTEAWPAPAPAPGGGSALSVFNLTNPNGIWSLYIVDDENIDSGSLAGGWCINLASAPCSNAADCNDNSLCTTDVCNAGICQYTSVSCTDSDACTQDNCDPGTGTCPHAPTNCDDANACTTDSCDSGTGCAHAALPLPIVTGLKFAANKHAITWNPVVGGAPYDIIYGDLQILHSSGVTASVGGCLGDNGASPSSDDSDTPAAGGGFYYISRSRGCGGVTGTYNEGGNQVANRDPLIPAPPVDCSRP